MELHRSEGYLWIAWPKKQECQGNIENVITKLGLVVAFRAKAREGWAVTRQKARPGAGRTDRVGGRWCAIDGLLASAKAGLVLPPRCSGRKVTLTPL
jgi:hypothetical protein